MFNRLVDLLYPPACLLCHASLPLVLAAPSGLQRGRPMLCGDCANSMEWNGRPVCVRCGIGLPGAFDAVLACRHCRSTPPAFAMARAPWRYTGVTRVAVRQFKYHRHWRIGTWLAEGMSVLAQSALPINEIDLVVPVPLHWLKHQLQGVNPAGQLAQTVARSLEKPCAPQALRRTRWTHTQTTLSSAWRRRNVTGAFKAQPRLVADRAILLVDDVLTSSATADACARALNIAGARCVFVLAAARTPLE